MSKKLIVSGQEFNLSEDADLDTLRAEIAERVRGAASDPWLKLPNRSKVEAWVLITPGSSAAIEHRPAGSAATIIV